MGALLETPGLSYQFGGFTLDLAKGCVFKGVQEIKLRPKVYEALKYLVEHPGRLVGKQELMQAVSRLVCHRRFPGAVRPRASSRTG